MRFLILKTMTASVVLFFGCQTSLMAENGATGQTANEQQPAAQSTARTPTATIPPQPAWRGYHPYRPYDRPWRRRGSGSGFGFGSGSGPSWGSGSGPRFYDRGRGPRDWDWDRGGMGFGW